MTFLWIFTFFVFCTLLSFVLVALSFILGSKKPYVSKVSAYECGFTSINQPSHPFSIKFFSIGVIFLIFDLEIIYLIPWSLASASFTLFLQFVVFIFLILVVIGLIYEWFKGGLEWL